ncbi:luciferase domain-containing protein [Streptomyces cadmiisoli]|uniref:luciferase domain-containing protein n=1 Tax=Streptomyces cadmiisoli TaxID=2184053 RepID=UPI00365148E1
MTLAQRALERLQAWPDLTAGPASCGTGRAVRSARSEIAHFHTPHDVDLYLAGRAIGRFADDLRESTAIRLVPGSRWVTVHLDCDTDVDLLLSLVSVALQAHQDLPAEASAGGCNFHRVTVLRRDPAGAAHPVP